MLDYLSFFLHTLDFYQPTAALIKQCLYHTAHKQVIDLCSGGGGPLLQVEKHLVKGTGYEVPITLSDKYPNIDAFEIIRSSRRNFNYITSPVDAANVPGEYTGVRTMYSAFHHFKPQKAKAILQDAVDAGMPIAIFDGGDKNILSILGIIILHPIVFFFCTPFFRPFRLSRIFFTYIIPLIPLCTVWDGVISILRLYQPKDLLKLANEINAKDYHWEAGKLKHGLGIHITYLIGYKN